MPFVIYAFMLIAVLSSLALGLDWVVTPPQRAATSQLSGPASIPMAEPAPVAKVVPAARETAPPSAAAVSAPVSPSVAAAGSVVPSSQRTATPPESKQTTAQSSDEKPAPVCNVQACSAAYVSFRESDCTYQPYDGPRRQCEK